MAFHLVRSLHLLNVYAHTPDELEEAFKAAVLGGAGGMVIGADNTFYLLTAQLVALADRFRLPAIYPNPSHVIAGGLICYAADARDSTRLVGEYTGRILKGEKPADIPVQQSTKTKLMINLKTAAALGITVPQRCSPAPMMQSNRTLIAAVHESENGRFCCKSRCPDG